MSRSDFHEYVQTVLRLPMYRIELTEKINRCPLGQPTHVFDEFGNCYRVEYNEGLPFARTLVSSPSRP